VRHDPRPAADNHGEPDYEDENIRVWSVPLSAAPAPSHTPGHQSPKKRKLGPSSDAVAAAGEDEEVAQAIRENIIKDMFGSRLSLDTLREMRLADVRLPAKIFVRNAQGHIEAYAGPPASAAPDTKVLVQMPWSASAIESLPQTQPSRQSMCYIVKCHDRRGRFNPDEAIRLGVQKPDFKKLAAGETVLGKDSVPVTPDMVLAAPVKGHGFAIVDIPSEDLLQELVTRPEFSNPTIMENIDVMYWILADSVSLDNPTVQQFMRAHSSVKHTVLDGRVCPNIPALEDPMAQMIKMNRIDERRFPLPSFDAEPISAISQELQSIAEAARAGLKYQLAPKAIVDEDGVVKPMDTRRPIWDLTRRSPQVLELANAASRSVSDPSFIAEADAAQRDLPCPEAEIIPLGTGSSLPSKYRNVTATLIRVPGQGSYLLDCGENTLGQLRRCFGYQGADDILRDLRAIYISHAHADHHLGTISIVARWRDVSSDTKLAIIATPKYQSFVDEFHQVQELSRDRLVPVTLRFTAGRPVPGTLARTTFPVDHDPESLVLPEIAACFVDHCYEATAVVLTFPDSGLKIAYSGDCRPSEPFADLGRGAHLLIHECTFDNELAGDAAAKKHSTLAEALGVGKRMEARRILMTHFSQRYPKLPVIDEAALKSDTAGRDVEVLFAFDMMRVRLGEFKQAKMFLPALRSLLQDDEPKPGDEEGEQ
jgi:ribonuclease Z